MSNLQEIMAERRCTGQLKEVKVFNTICRRNQYNSIQFNRIGNLKIVNLLIANGLDTDIEDKNGTIAMDLAKKYGIFNIFSFGTSKINYIYLKNDWNPL